MPCCYLCSYASFTLHRLLNLQFFAAGLVWKSEGMFCFSFRWCTVKGALLHPRLKIKRQGGKRREERKTKERERAKERVVKEEGGSYVGRSPSKVPIAQMRSYVGLMIFFLMMFISLFYTQIFIFRLLYRILFHIFRIFYKHIYFYLLHFAFFFFFSVFFFFKL